MSELTHLFEQNRIWSETVCANDPGFFDRLSRIQNPEYLWIGCSDSRVPANQITGLQPGEVFVHRNVANVVVHSDLNMLSALQFSVDVLHVKHILVVGHYGCGGVQAALCGTRLGLVDNWLRHIQDVHQRHRDIIDAPSSSQVRHDRLCELNAIEQALNVCHTTVLREAWDRGQEITVHAWIYGLSNGIVRDLGFSVAASGEVLPRYEAAVAGVRETAG